MEKLEKKLYNRLKEILYEKILNSDIRSLPWKEVNGDGDHVANFLYNHIGRHKVQKQGYVSGNEYVSVQDVLNLFDETNVRMRGCLVLEKEFGNCYYEITKKTFAMIGFNLPDLKLMPNVYGFIVNE